MLKDKNILLCVTGGIAAYKAVQLVSLLKKASANVKVIMTEHACKFVTPLTFQTMSENPVYVDMFHPLSNMDVEHISLAKWADLIVVAPATANTIAKINLGIGDNMLTTVLLAKRSPVLIAPAMNTKMMDNPVNKKHLKELEDKDFIILPCGDGRLACGDIGTGKMLDPEQILEYIEIGVSSPDFKDKNIIITAGGTREALDPVRYLGNRSTGKMGYAIAREARNRGANVILITAPTSLTPPEGVKVVPVESTKDMYQAVEDHFEKSDIFICPAAPADYKAKHYSDHKIKKTQGDDTLVVEFDRNPDILQNFGNKKGNRIVVGFAAESQKVTDYASKKLNKKNLDFIVANNITKKGAGFSSDTNIVTIIDKEGPHELEMMGKDELAKVIMDKIKGILEQKS